MNCSSEELIELVGGPQDGLELKKEDVTSIDGDLFLTIKAILHINENVDLKTFHVAEYEYDMNKYKYFFNGVVCDTDDFDGLVDVFENL